MTAQDTPASAPNRPKQQQPVSTPDDGTTVPPMRSVDTTTRTPNRGTQPDRADASLRDQADMPQLPHERDQSVGMTDGNPSPAMQQAYKDVTRGLVDTDAGREAHNVGHGKPVQPSDPVHPGTPGPVEPDHK